MKIDLLTFTDFEGKPMLVTKQHITHAHELKGRPEIRAIHTTGGEVFSVKETLEEIRNAITGNVETNPTNDFVK